jgi:catechol 2,3-dioxygenase-like lactoylglutathione lyase family enzyme
MPIEKLDHYAVRTPDLARSIDFYAKTLGLVCGPRPSFLFPGAWLYQADEHSRPIGGGLVHLIGTAQQDTGGLSDYLGDKTAIEKHGTGPLDHIAFNASDIAAMYRRLSLNALAFRERRVPGLPLHQLFIEDTCGVIIELNYAGSVDLAAADARASASVA